MKREELEALGVGEEALEAIMESEEKIRGEYEDRIKGIEREAEIADILRESGAKNVKAARALLEKTDGDDYRESVRAEIEALKKDGATRFLFESGVKAFEPARSGERLPDSVKGDYEGQLAAARSRGDRIAAIKIKQKAASEGIALM